MKCIRINLLNNKFENSFERSSKMEIMESFFEDKSRYL